MLFTGRSVRSLIAGLVLGGALVAPSGCGPKYKAATVDASAKSAAAGKGGPTTQPAEEIEAVIIACNLQGEQLADFQRRLAVRKEKADVLEKGPEAEQRAALRAQIAEAKKANDDAKVAELEAKLKPLADAYFAQRSALRAQAFAGLSAQQQQQWIGYVLWHRGLAGRFRKAELTPAQADQALAICIAVAGEWMKASALASDPYLRTLGDPANDARGRATQQITDQVLTAEQKAKMAPPAPKATPTPAPAKATPAPAKDAKKS